MTLSRISVVHVRVTSDRPGALLRDERGCRAHRPRAGHSAGVVPPTVHYETRDPACDLHYVRNVARDLRVHHALSTSIGFGGHNACLGMGAVA
jgi:hypothetical protein